MLPKEENPNTETVEATPQAVVVPDAPTEEVFDKERAMLTIHKQREAEKEYKKQLKELETLKAEKVKREEAEMTESQRLQKQADELAMQNAKLQADILRRDVIAETGIPAIFADRLKGNTKDEMLADAQELAKSLPQMKIAPKVPPTNPPNAQNVETEAQKRERLFGKQQNVFNIDAIRAGGGGVVWNTPPKQE